MELDQLAQYGSSIHKFYLSTITLNSQEETLKNCMVLMDRDIMVSKLTLGAQQINQEKDACHGHNLIKINSSLTLDIIHI